MEARGPAPSYQLYGLTHFLNCRKYAGSPPTQLHFPHCSKILEVSRWRALMALRGQSTARLIISRLTSVSVGLCLFTFTPFLLLAGPTGVEVTEGECPDRESSEEELAVRSSACRRLNNQRHSGLRWPCETGDRLHQSDSHTGRPLAIVGHQLANGLCAPLLI
jgi:hypothetical protein